MRDAESSGPSLNLPVRQIVSGGQTGVDQAALQMALDLGIAHGGWCPRGRRCEAGLIPDRFRLSETESSKYWVRTEKNVVDSQATLILHRGPLTGGTAFTERMAAKHGRPRWLVDLNATPDPAATRQWLQQMAIEVLNVAGPRESTSPGIYAASHAFLVSIFRPGG
jgi:hypothetical protein